MAPDGNLFILDQATRTIYQTTPDGTLVAGTPLSSKLKRPEALAYDAENDVFYVAGGWSADLFKVSRSGEILETITVLREHRLPRSEEHTSELQSLMRISYAVFCLKNKNT